MNSLNILFWNIGKQDASQYVTEFANKYNIDILVLIENETPRSQILKLLNKNKTKYFLCSHSDRKITIFTSFGKKSFENISSTSNYLSIVKLKFITSEIVFGAIHLPSKVRGTRPESYSMIARKLIQEIHELETKLGHNHTLLVGDFNMNPFENAMVEADGFNAAMCREIVNTTNRNVSGLTIGTSKQFMYFYNPMWSFLGDLSKYRPGTYYYHGNQMENHFRWNMLDQVLIRPSLIPKFDENSLEIIDKDVSGNILIDSKVKSRRKSQIFDHLPVFFSLDLTK